MTIHARESNQTPSPLRCAASISRKQPERACRGGGIQPVECFAGAREAADPVQGGGHVRPVVDRLVDVSEGDASEPRSVQDRCHGRRIGERERIGSRGTGGCRSPGSGQGVADSDAPLVALVRLPHHHHQPSGRAQRPPDVGERGHGVTEEHRAEPADGQVEALLRKGVDLRVGALEGDVAYPLRLGELAGPLDGGFGDVDPERAAGPRQARGLAGGLPEPASDVQDLLAGLDATCPAQHLIVQPYFGVVANQARPVHGCPAYKDPASAADAAIRRNSRRAEGYPGDGRSQCCNGARQSRRSASGLIAQTGVHMPAHAAHDH